MFLRSALLAKGGTLKNRPLPHLHKVPTESNTVSPWTFQMALVIQHKHCLHYIIPNWQDFHVFPLITPPHIALMNHFLLFIS